MRNRSPVTATTTCLLTTVLLIASPIELRGEEFDLYFLGGQSNMEGFGTVGELPESMSGEVDGVLIFQSTPKPDQVAADGSGDWASLQPGHGTGFKHASGKNQYSNRFGVEISFARTLRAKNATRRIALIKYARNGSSIAAQAAANFGCWEPDFDAEKGEHRDVNQYDHFLATVRNALSDADIDDDGTPDQLIPKGILWMQGESDATLEGTAIEYEANLKRLMDLIRAAFRHDDLPVVVGRISDSGRSPIGKVWLHGETVRAAQQSFADKDASAAIVTTTDDYEYSDRWHYDSAGYIDLGTRFAEAMLTLQAGQ